MMNINRNDFIGKRLSWEKIEEYFPEQWVGVVDVIYKDGNLATIESAVLKYIDKSQSELIHLALIGDCISRYTTLDLGAESGVVE